MWVGAVGLTSWVSSVGHRPGDVRPPPPSSATTPGRYSYQASVMLRIFTVTLPLVRVDAISSDGTS
jgi:hypothetical protein